MTYHQVTELLAPLAVALGVDFDEASFDAYHRALRDIPLAFLVGAVNRAAKTPRDRFEPRFPTAPKLREWAEETRLDASKAHAWRPCTACQFTPRFVEGEDGRMKRCDCWRDHQKRIESIGLSMPLALPPAEAES